MGSPPFSEPTALTLPSPSDSPHWLEVWVDGSQGPNTYTYAIPADSSVRVGDIVAVPFGSKVVNGIVLQTLTHPGSLATHRIRAIEGVVATGILPGSFWILLQRVSEYYLTSMTQVLRTVLPAGLLQRSQKRVALVAAPLLQTGFLSDPGQAVLDVLQAKNGDVAWLYLKRQVPQATQGLNELQRLGCIKSYWQETSAPQSKQQQAVTLCDDSCDGLTPTQQTVLVSLKRLGGDLWLTDLLAQTGSTRSVVQSLARKGRVQISQRQALRTATGRLVAPDQPRILTPDQQIAVKTVLSHLQTAQTFLLHGVTGSGKTEVYLQIIAQVLEHRQSALVLVPEIGLTPQLTDRFQARFGSKVLVYHSGLSAGERFDTWRLMVTADPVVVIGTRSAIFAPLPTLGILILDEEHDDSYKQDQPQPCYHARTVATWRSELSQCPLLLGTATPALETYLQSVEGTIHTLSMPHRVGVEGQRPTLPTVTLVDMRLELAKGNRSVLSDYLSDAIDRTTAQNEQCILFVPRRGYSTFVMCRACGHVLLCDHCDVSLTFHQIGTNLRCHYCGDQRPHPSSCPACGSYLLKHFGSGTQKVVDQLTLRWPHLRILRFDSDATTRKGSHRTLLDQFARGDADILVGTQMLTKGLDVANVTLVGVVAADGLLNVADFRATERSFQLLTQVAGRAGRGSVAGQVIIQTYLPDHPTLAAVQTYDFQRFVTQELQNRAESGYPPYQSMILLRLSSTDPDCLQATCDHLAHQLNGIPAEILGPCPAQVQRVSGWYRWQLLIKQVKDLPWERSIIDTYLKDLRVPKEVRLSLDVDPLRIL